MDYPCKRCPRNDLNGCNTSGLPGCYWTQYKKRIFCDRTCMAADFRRREKRATSWMTVHYHARNTLPSGCCEICGSQKNVDVHHKDGNPQNNDPLNLMRLCRSCHLKQHRGRKSCSICGKPVKGLGFCEKHYQRFKKYGDPLMFKRNQNTPVIRLED